MHDNALQGLNRPHMSATFSFGERIEGYSVPVLNERAVRAAAAQAPVDPAKAERCKVPDFAKALGHEAMWKLHHNCK